MNRQNKKILLNAIIVIILIALSQHITHMGRISDVVFKEQILFYISTSIHLGIFVTWVTNIRKRIMQRYLRQYLFFLGITIVLWVTFRSLKWSIFVLSPFFEHLTWYAFYFPMIMIPLTFFFMTLSINLDENHRPDKKWNLLYIPAVFLILLVLTNDFHQLVFTLDITILEKYQTTTREPWYYVIVVFTFSLLIAAIFTLTRNFIKTSLSKKAPKLLIYLFIATAGYLIIYYFFPIISIYFTDLTTFICLISLAFFEACIQEKLIHSNTSHNEFFEISDIEALILSSDGTPSIKSATQTAITNEQFLRLKEASSITIDKSTLGHLAPINGGYIFWKSDVSEIYSLIDNLEQLNESLVVDVTILAEENKQKEERTRIKEQEVLHELLIEKMIPHSKKVEDYIRRSKDLDYVNRKKLLYEISIVSVYIKRKVNLIIMGQTDKLISTEEMVRAFEESFQILRFSDINCAINITDSFLMSFANAIITYDLFEALIEKVKFDINTLYITYSKDVENLRFTIQFDKDLSNELFDVIHYQTELVKQFSGKLVAVSDDDSFHLKLILPNI